MYSGICQMLKAFSDCFIYPSWLDSQTVLRTESDCVRVMAVKLAANFEALSEIYIARDQPYSETRLSTVWAHGHALQGQGAFINVIENGAHIT